MPIDASIYSQFARPAKSVADYDNEYETLQANKLQNALGKAKMDEYSRGVERQNKLASLLGSGADAQGLRQGGFLKEAQDWEKASADVQKDKAQAVKFGADTDKTKLETALQRVSAGAQILSGVKDQATYDMARQAVAQNFGPEAAAQMPPQYDPAMVEQKRQQGMTIQQQLEQQWKDRGYDLDVRKQGEVERNNKTQNAISQGNLGVAQGQLGVAQANLGLRKQELGASMSKPFEVTGPDGTPLLVQQDKQGNITPVQGFGPKAGASKPLNDSQAKALLFGTRMQEADKLLAGLDYSPAALGAKQVASNVPLIGGITGGVANAMLSPQNQQAEQAQRDFINAVLRRESGAAISETEFDNARKQYFPQPGDSAQVKQQKSNNRKLATSGLLAEVPEGQRKSITPSSSAPNIDNLLDKYK